jgi:predicted lipoprotein with Yx(FWY)xxD motif
MNHPILRSALGLFLVAVLAAACSTSGGATASPSAAAPSVAPSMSEAPSTAPSEAPSEAPSVAAGATVEATAVGDIGTVLVDGKSKLTVYIFTMDVKDSGTSACSGECLANWPALTVAAGETPTGGPGVTGTLGTITRDDGVLQVTYNGLPLYFFKNDQAPGDANGVYENWEAVKP